MNINMPMACAEPPTQLPNWTALVCGKIMRMIKASTATKAESSGRPAI